MYHRATAIDNYTAVTQSAESHLRPGPQCIGSRTEALRGEFSRQGYWMFRLPHLR